MDPRTALDEQIASYRRMTGEQRLGIALELHELACDVARAGIRTRWPHADDAEVDRRLRARIALGRGSRGLRAADSDD
jgi:hypothetical protein